MFKKVRKYLSLLLVLCLICATFNNVSYAAEGPDEGVIYEANDYYTYIVSVKTGKAIQVTGANNAAVTANAEIDSVKFDMKN